MTQVTDDRAGGPPSGPLRALLMAAPALFMIGLSALVFVGTSELRIWRGITPGPRFFPIILASVGVLLGVLLLVSQWRGTDAGMLDLPGRYGAQQVGAIIVLLVLFAAGTPIIGMVPMVAVFALATLLLVMRQRLLPSLTAAAIIALGIQVVFVQWLSVALPTFGAP